MARMARMARVLKDIFSIANGEFILDSRANGGGGIAFRAFWSSCIIFFLAILLYEIINPASKLCFSFNELRKSTHENFEWFGAIYVAIYVALYSRFSSQWSYLAQVYNQIMQSVAELPDNSSFTDPPLSSWAISLNLNRKREVYAIWMAGFIADAMEMHLARKGIFSECVHSMFEMKGVKEAFLDGGDENKKDFDDFYTWYHNR